MTEITTNPQITNITIASSGDTIMAVSENISLITVATQGAQGPQGLQGPAGQNSTPGGSDTQMQYNDAGSLGGANIYYDDVTGYTGFGTVTSPLHLLHLGQTADDNGIRLYGYDNVSNQSTHWYVNANGDTCIYSSKDLKLMPQWDMEIFLAGSGDDFVVYGQGSDIFHMHHSGELGLGTASATYQLELSNRIADQFKIDDGEGSAIVDIDADVGGGTGSLVFGDVNDISEKPRFTIDITNGRMTFENANIGFAGQFDVNAPLAGGLEVRNYTSSEGILYITNESLSIADGDKLGSIKFQAVGTTAGGDADLTAAQIWAEADAAFSSTVNSTDLVFATGSSEVATEKMRLTHEGNLGIGDDNPASELTVAGDVEATGSSNGLILESPNGTRWRVTVDNSGVLSTTSL